MDTLTEGHMPKRMMLFVPAILVILLAAVALMGRPGVAADECVTRHASEAPEGSHWYYRVDRANNRRCWFLGPADKKMRTRQAVSHQPQPAAKADAPAEVAPVQVVSAQAQVAPAQVATVKLATVKVTTGQVTSAEVALAAAASSNDVPAAGANPARLAGTIDGDPVSTNNADPQPAPQAQDDTPPVPPNSAAADLSTPASEPGIRIELLLAALAGALALAAMIAERMVRRSGRRGRARSDLPDQSGSPTNAPRLGEHASPAFARTVTPPRQADIVRKPIIAATRTAGAGHETVRPSDPGCDIEERLQRLLRDWQRTAA